MPEDRLLAGLRAAATALDTAAPRITADGLPAGARGADRRPLLLALVGAFVVVVGAAAWLLARDPGADDSVVAPTTTSVVRPSDLAVTSGFAVQGTAGRMTLYDFEGRELVDVDAPGLVDGPQVWVGDDLAAGVPPPDPAEVPPGCSSAASGGGVRVALCDLYRQSEPQSIDAVGPDGSRTPLIGSVDDPASPMVLGHWRWALVSPDGRWVLAQRSSECESPTAFVVAVDGSFEPRTVSGEPIDRWWETAPESRALGWAPDGRALIEIMDGACGLPFGEPGVYLLDPATGERELVRADDGGTAYGWTVGSPGFTPTERVLAPALAELGYDPCCGTWSHGPVATAGVVYEGHDLPITGGPTPTDGSIGPDGQRLPLLSGEAVVTAGAVHFWCGPDTWSIGWLDDGTTPEVDSMLLFAEELVPHLACTLRAPPEGTG